MISSAQKSPVTSAALTALNVAVVRQVVFKRAAEQIFDKQEDATQQVVQTAERTRSRTEAVGDVIESNGDRSQSQADTGHDPGDQSELQAPDFAASTTRGGSVDINI